MHPVEVKMYAHCVDKIIIEISRDFAFIDFTHSYNSAKSLEQSQATGRKKILIFAYKNIKEKTCKYIIYILYIYIHVLKPKPYYKRF